MRSLVAESLVIWLTKEGVFAQGFTNEGVILIVPDCRENR